MHEKRKQIEALINDNAEVFEDVFLLKSPSAEELKKAEVELNFKIPESYLWFLEQYGHGGFLFEFLGYGLTSKALFVKETLKQRENDLPRDLLVIENCDEYVTCINIESGSIVSWSQHDNDGIIIKTTCFEDYFIECLKNAIDNY